MHGGSPRYTGADEHSGPLRYVDGRPAVYNRPNQQCPPPGGGTGATGGTGASTVAISLAGLNCSAAGPTSHARKLREREDNALGLVCQHGAHHPTIFRPTACF